MLCAPNHVSLTSGVVARGSAARLWRYFCAEPATAATEHPERLDAVTVERSPVTINTDRDGRAILGSVSTFYDLGSTPQGNWEGSDMTPLSAHLAAGRGFRIPDGDLTALVEKVISSHSTERERHMSLGHCLGAAIESDREGSITRIFSTLGSTPPRHPTLASLLLVYLLTRSSPLEYKGLLEASAACAGDREDELTAVDAYRIRLATLASPLATELLDETDNAHSMSLSFINFVNHIVRGSAQASREAAKRERIEGGWRDIYDISELIGKPQLYPPDASENAQWGFYTGTAPNREFTDVGSLFFPVVDPIEKVVYETNDGFHYVNDKTESRWIHRLRHKVAEKNGYTIKMSPLADWCLRPGIREEKEEH